MKDSSHGLLYRTARRELLFKRLIRNLFGHPSKASTTPAPPAPVWDPATKQFVSQTLQLYSGTDVRERLEGIFTSLGEEQTHFGEKPGQTAIMLAESLQQEPVRQAILKYSGLALDTVLACLTKDATEGSLYHTDLAVRLAQGLSDPLLHQRANEYAGATQWSVMMAMLGRTPEGYHRNGQYCIEDMVDIAGTLSPDRVRPLEKLHDKETLDSVVQALAHATKWISPDRQRLEAVEAVTAIAHSRSGIALKHIMQTLAAEAHNYWGEPVVRAANVLDQPILEHVAKAYADSKHIADVLHIVASVPLRVHEDVSSAVQRAGQALIDAAPVAAQLYKVKGRSMERDGLNAVSAIAILTKDETAGTQLLAAVRTGDALLDDTKKLASVVERAWSAALYTGSLNAVTALVKAMAGRKGDEFNYLGEVFKEAESSGSPSIIRTIAVESASLHGRDMYILLTAAMVGRATKSQELVEAALRLGRDKTGAARMPVLYCLSNITHSRDQTAAINDLQMAISFIESSGRNVDAYLRYIGAHDLGDFVYPNSVQRTISALQQPDVIAAEQKASAYARPLVQDTIGCLALASGSEKYVATIAQMLTQLPDEAVSTLNKKIVTRYEYPFFCFFPFNSGADRLLSNILSLAQESVYRSINGAPKEAAALATGILYDIAYWTGSKQVVGTAARILAKIQPTLLLDFEEFIRGRREEVSVQTLTSYARASNIPLSGPVLQ